MQVSVGKIPFSSTALVKRLSKTVEFVAISSAARQPGNICQNRIIAFSAGFGMGKIVETYQRIWPFIAATVLPFSLQKRMRDSAICTREKRKTFRLF